MEVAKIQEVVGEKYCVMGEGEGEGEVEGMIKLTVRKTCVFYPGDGYAAYDHRSGELVFRVDTYSRRGPSLTDHLVLMDPSGAPILTVRRKWPSLHRRWEGFLGERKDGQKPLFTVKRSSIFGADRSTIDVELHDNGSNSNGGKEYRIEGNFAQRNCKILMCSYINVGDVQDGDSNRSQQEEEVVVAEIKRKVDACSHVVLSKDVFCLWLRPGFDSAFAMGLVLILDQISGDDDGEPDPAAVAPAFSSDEDGHES